MCNEQSWGEEDLGMPWNRFERKRAIEPDPSNTVLSVNDQSPPYPNHEMCAHSYQGADFRE